MMNPPRNLFTYLIVFSFLLFLFLSSNIKSSVVGLFLPTKHVFPDFSQYNALRTLSKDEYPIDSQNKRVIIVGDIHGSSKPLHTLLDKLTYNPDFDTLIHVGDTIAKGSHEGSLAVLSYLAEHNVTGVRGNHDQKVVEWRAWMGWIRGMEGGEKWLAEIDERGSLRVGVEVGGESGVEEWVEEELKRSGGKWEGKIPKGWKKKMFRDHYKIARDMTQKQYEYLLSLPLVLHVPSAHTYILHAGLLPYDPTRPETHKRQPLSHVPSLSSHPSVLKNHPNPNPNPMGKEKDIPHLRLLQELAILHDIPQNTDPWVKQNMRSVLDNNKITKKSKKGTPWSDLWNAAMGRCDGFGLGDGYEVRGAGGMGKGMGKKLLPCRPSTVVYGHAASRGVDIKRWSIGTDSGCVYGRQLSALVLGHQSSTSLLHFGDEDADLYSIPYGDDAQGHIVSVKCY